MKISERQAASIKTLCVTAQQNNQVLNHPIATLELLRTMDPGLDIVENIYPWIRQHENEKLTMQDIVTQLLLTIDEQE